MSENAIIPKSQHEIDFYDDKVTAVLAPDGTVYVPLRPVCELIGVSWGAQRRKLQNDPVMSDVLRSVAIRPRTLSDPSQPKTSKMVCIPLDYLNGWLFAINANRVRDDVKENVMRYQRECYKVLYEAFSTGVAERPDSDIMQSADDAAVTYRHLVQMARLARQHYYLSKKVDEHDEQLADHTKRLGLIEAQLSNPAAYVTQEQAQLISSGVKAIATVLGKQSGRNEFGSVYGELYQRYGVTSYKQIATSRYDEVMTWLRNWWVELRNDSNAPF